MNDSSSADAPDGFSAEVYRRFNIDLKHFSDAELAAHFAANPHERRIYGPTSSLVASMSMRWLRGQGVEIGAGGSPTPLFGDARSLQADCDPSLAFGGTRRDLSGSIDDPAFAAQHRGQFDFVIASHVLEHADSFIRAVENMLALLRSGGVAYIVLPDIRFLHDHTWMERFDFDHHVVEYQQPLAFATLHDAAYVRASSAGIDDANEYANLSADYREAIKSGSIPPAMRFLHHKHNYEFQDWVVLVLKVRDFLQHRFDLEDLCYGHERLDCHFVLVNKA